MDIKGTIAGVTSKVGPWGLAAGGVLLVGLVYLLTKGSGSTSSTAMPAADINDWLNQLQSAADSLVDSKTNPPTESVDGDHPDYSTTVPWKFDPITGVTSIGRGGMDYTWVGGEYVPGVGGVAYGDMPTTRTSGGTLIRRGTTTLSGDTNRVQVEARAVSTSLLSASRNAVVSR